MRRRSWHRGLSLLLLLGIGLSSVEIVWGEARTGGDADSVSVALVVADGDEVPQTPDQPQAPLRHAGHDPDCPCLCAGAVGAILPNLDFYEAPVEAAFHPEAAAERAPPHIAPEPLLRPPLA